MKVLYISTKLPIPQISGKPGLYCPKLFQFLEFNCKTHRGSQRKHLRFFEVKTFKLRKKICLQYHYVVYTGIELGLGPWALWKAPLSRHGSAILLLVTSGWQSPLWTLFSSSIRRGLNRTAPNNAYPLNPLFRMKSSLTSIRTFGSSGITFSHPWQLHLNPYNSSFIDKKSQHLAVLTVCEHVGQCHPSL